MEFGAFALIAIIVFGSIAARGKESQTRHAETKEEGIRHSNQGGILILIVLAAFGGLLALSGMGLGM